MTGMRSPGAARQAASMERKRRGRRIARPEVHEVGLSEKLIAEGLLSPAQADDNRAVDRALSRVIELWIGPVE